uniref:Receptor-type tyrosine-protein phosphatase kappa n=1 Tax=Astyanax mexicanus TaxID=7994 RepID=A0A8B9LK01_ASTMX
HSFAAQIFPVTAELTLLIPEKRSYLPFKKQFKCGCSFDDGPAQCDYQQDPYDDFDWTHVSAQEVPYLSSELPQGSYMMVDSSQHDPGEKARLMLPVMKENDTHCIDFNYLLYSSDASSPGTLNILVKVNKGPLANPIWNITTHTGKDWKKAELAVSTFWPNEYQVKADQVLSSESESFILKYIVIQLRSFSRNQSSLYCYYSEYNASYELFRKCRCASRRNGEDIPVAEKKNINHRKFAASFRLKEVTNQDQDLYRCVTQSERGSGVSNFAGLIVREPPRPIAPPQLLGVGPTYLLIQLNANSIFGDGPIILKEVEYRMTSGTWTETHAVNSPNYKLWHLDPDTEYEIRVLLTRPGEGGTGQPGPALITRTKCAVPGPVPSASLKATPFEDRIFLHWKEPLEPNGIITQYEISYSSVRSFDPSVPLLRPPVMVSLPWNASHHVFSQLHPGTTYQFLIRARTSKGFGLPTTINITTNISAPTLEEYDGSEAFLNETATTITVLLKPAQAKGETKTQCVRLATKGATEEPEVIPDPAKQTDRVVKIAGISAGVLVFILLLLVAILLVKKRKLAKKRKDAIGNTRQEMTHMVNAMDRSYAEQSTLHAEDPMSVTFMDSHTFNNRYENHAAAAENSRLLDVPRYHCEGTESPYQTGQLHPAIRVADLLQHINLMKTSDSYGFKEEYESFFEGQSASWDVAKKEQNRTKNRYGNIIAYDHSRVILQPMEDDPSSDYINANYIDVSGDASPPSIGEGVRNSSPSLVCQVFYACLCLQYYTIYSFLSLPLWRFFFVPQRGFNELREVKQFHFTGWPDHGVPYHATGLLSFIRRVKMSNPPSAGPIVVHCSAGAGRTGCYIVIDIMLDMAEREGVVDIYNCVKALRSRRINMVQTEEQYIFIHDAILEACLCGDTAIPACEFKAAYYDMIRIDSQSNSSHLKDEFQTLNSVTPQPQPEDCSIALLPRNHDKNRFMDNLPPDRCLPFLITIDGESSNYINAALMDSYRQPAAFIVTQHPLPNTVKDFWRLVYDYGCTSIVMLNEIDLAQGCPQYWPEEGMLRYGPVQVERVSCSMDCDVISRLFRICNLTRPQEGYLMVRQFQYLGWAGHREVPASKRSFLKLILQVDKWQEECEEGEGRTIVHCLNGGGRSGMFSAISIVCEMIKRQNVVDVFHAVKSLRNSKPNMVDSPVRTGHSTFRSAHQLLVFFLVLGLEVDYSIFLFSTTILVNIIFYHDTVNSITQASALP